jgi:hypothetical protein
MLKAAAEANILLVFLPPIIHQHLLDMATVEMVEHIRMWFFLE